MKPSICQYCEKEAAMFEGDNTGYCYEHTAEHAREEWELEQKEERTGISQLDISMRAREKMISFAQAEEELLKEKGN